MANFAEIEQMRAQFLWALYQEVGGVMQIQADPYKLGKHLRYSKNDTDKIAMYLEQVGLIVRYAMGGISITQQGIDVIHRIARER